MREKNYIFCFGCETEYKIWHTEFENENIEIISFTQQEMENKQRLREITEDILRLLEHMRPVILFTHAFMDLNIEKFYLSLPPQAHIVPVGTEAILLGCGTADPVHVEEINKYLLYSGTDNIISAGNYMRRNLLGDDSIVDIAPPRTKPFDGIFSFDSDEVYCSFSEFSEKRRYDTYVGMLVNRQNWVREDLAGEKELAKCIERHGIGVIPVFSNAGANSLSFDEVMDAYFTTDGNLKIEALINFQMFGIKAKEGNTVAEQSVIEFERLGIPVISPIRSFYLTKEQWLEMMVPISSDMPSSLITPEMGGMIEPVIISVRGAPGGKSEALPERAEYLARRISKILGLRTKPNSEKKIVFMLHNSVCAGVEATIGKAYGLDAFESAVKILDKLGSEGYYIGEFPETGEMLKSLIMEKKAFSDFRWTAVEDIVSSGGCLYQMPVAGEYELFYNELPEELRDYTEKTWGVPPGEGMVLDGNLIITGVRFGNVLVMIQPKRGCYGAKCTGEVCKILHDPACPPPHQYLATYRYIERVFGADACIDIGTDGSLEYLPGKSNGLSELCWPGIVLGSTPSLYAYNAGVINEGLVVKRRINSVIVDYLPPSSTGADENSRRLVRRIDDYFRAKEIGNGQEKEAESDIHLLAVDTPAASRILERAGDENFEQGLMELAGAVKITEQARNISELHVFGVAPNEQEIQNFIREICDGDGIENNPDMPLADAEEIRRRLLQTDNEINMLIRGLSGRYIPSGESGMPDENGRNIIPTGRNMFGINADKVPSKAAYERGKTLAQQLLENYQNDEGKLPERIAMNMISSDVTRSNGEQLSQFLCLLGVEPMWDARDRMSGLNILSIKELERPRIDTTVRISGVLRDTWPSVVELMDEAVLMVAALDESDEENYILKHLREYQRTSDFADDEDRRGAIRIFGDAPGTYGAGIDLALLASAWKDEADLAKYFIQASAYAYGGKLNGRKSIREFIDNAKNVDLSYDTTGSRRINGIADNFGVQVQGGYRLVAKYLGNKNIRQYQGTNERGRAIITETLADNLKRNVEETLLNEFWKENMMQRGYDGASDIMRAIQSVFESQCVADCFTDDFLDKVAEDYVNDEWMRKWLSENNKFALEEIARRMLELYTRKKWNPVDEVLEKLKESYLKIEGDMEDGLESVGEIQGGNVDIINDADVEGWRERLVELESLIGSIKTD